MITSFAILVLSLVLHLSAPTGSPQFLRSTDISSGSISLRWDQVSCLDRNGPIQQYSVSYGILESSQRINVVSTSTQLTITNLVSDSTYVIQVAASNVAGLGPNSRPLILVLPIAG